MVDRKLEFTPVKFHKCNEEDRLSKFYGEPSKFNPDFVSDYFQFMNCLDEPEKLKLQGWVG